MIRIEALLKEARKDPRILAVLLFGSRARDEARPDSDFDVCLVVEPSLSPDEAPGVHLDFLNFDGVDLRIFQRLPVYIRQRVLAEGRVLYSRDEDRLYEVASRTVREFEDFRPFYGLHLEAAAHG